MLMTMAVLPCGRSIWLSLMNAYASVRAVGLIRGDDDHAAGAAHQLAHCPFDAGAEVEDDMVVVVGHPLQIIADLLQSGWRQRCQATAAGAAGDDVEPTRGEAGRHLR